MISHQWLKANINAIGRIIHYQNNVKKPHRDKPEFMKMYSLDMMVRPASAGVKSAVKPMTRVCIVIGSNSRVASQTTCKYVATTRIQHGCISE